MYENLRGFGKLYNEQAADFAAPSNAPSLQREEEGIAIQLSSSRRRSDVRDG